MTRRQRLQKLLWLAPTLLLGGCGGNDMNDLENYVQQVLAKPPGPIEPLPEIKPVGTFVYEPGDRRDPFTPDAQSAPEEEVVLDNGLAPDPNRRKEELEGYPLDSLRMVGTLEMDNGRWGLIRTKEGILHRVRVGNYLGQNNGQIISIQDDEIQLTEIVSDAPGQWRERAATVALSE
ncbi:pilus assembly protein PilP [Thiorhodococcus minor]|uniref:Pilus assembly protein PilP n=2 Tax=Thiorhodococcus minor TaxID=57489 RepID=A0A6M0JUS6_9GAMM|nr:pilus assembly protein PilP [Thiorhodococcus minor]